MAQNIRLCPTENDTAALAADIAGHACAGDIFLLHGSLGAGKSTFARAFIRTLCGADTEVPSPTFTLVQTYETPRALLWHFDLYRLEHPDEIFETGWEEALAGGIILVEWPERLGPYTPARAITIHFNPQPDQSREVVIHD